MTPETNLGSRVISPIDKPYIIAEIGVNHEGSMEQAKKLIEQAKQGGADAAKFQSYKAGSLASKNSPAYWDTNKEKTQNQYALFKKYDDFGEEEYVELAKHCKKIGIEFVSTPFDDEAVEFLNPLVSFFKIASADLTNTPFLRRVASKKKPVILSTGASTLPEIEQATQTLSQAGCPDIVLLHCILNYPTQDRDAHLAMIKNLKRVFPNHTIGYSDHTMPDYSMTALLSAYLLGAVVIEKHFTHDKTLPGNDHYHAMDLQDLLRFTELSNKAYELLGDLELKQPIESEAAARQHARRSLVLSTGLEKGQKLTEINLTYKRPGGGISPIHWDQVINRTVRNSLEADHILQWEDLTPSSA